MPPENKRMRAANRKKAKSDSSAEQLRKKNAAMYLRVSSEMQRENFSIAAQKEECIKYIEEKGLIITENHIYIDEGFSAKNEERPGFQRMMIDAQTGEFSLIVAHKMDRLERNLRAMLDLTDELKRIDVSVYCVHDHMTVTDDLFCRIMAVIHENYLTNLADEIAKGKHEASRQGNFIGSTAPFGYRLIPSSRKGDRRKLVPDDKEAAALIKCFEMYASGNYSLQDLAVYLNNLGFISRRGQPFGKETMRDMLENPIYYGKIYYQGVSNDDFYEIFDGNQKPLVDEETFYKAAEIRESRVKSHSQNKSSKESLKEHYLVQNLICCKACSRRLRVITRGKNTFMYMEYSAERGLECKDSNEYVDAGYLDQQVRDFMGSIVIPHSWADYVAQNTEKQDEINEIQAQIKNLENRMRRRTQAYTVAGVYSFEDFKIEQEQDKEEIERLTAKLPQSSAILNTEITITTSLIDLFKIATPQEQYDIVHYLFKNLYFDFSEYKLYAFEPKIEFDILFSTFADENGWVKENNFYIITKDTVNDGRKT